MQGDAQSFQRQMSVAGAGSPANAAVIAGPIAQAARRRRWRGENKGLVPYFFLGPFLVLFFIFFVIPIGYAFGLSLYSRVRTFGPNFTTKFSGLDNYNRVIHDSSFTDSVLRMLQFGIVQVPIMLGLALVFALLLDSPRLKGKTFFRLSYFVPFAIPGLVAGLLWGYLYSPELSPIIAFFQFLHLPKPDFYNGNVLWSIANIVTWEWTGYNMIVLYANLQGIPQELYEAARIDGCNAFQVVWNVKIPLVRSGIVFTGVLSIIGTLQLFTEPQILGTMTAIDSAFTPNLYSYNMAFSYNSPNYSAAISFTLAAVIFVFSYGFLRLAQRGQEV